MDLRSMSDKKFTHYRTNFFTEVKDWTASVISEADKIKIYTKLTPRVTK